MAINASNKQQLKNRLAKAMGHLNYVHGMIEDEKYCVDVLNQLKAVQSALDKTSEAILRQHLETCVTEAIEANDGKRVIDELITVFRKSPELGLDDLKLNAIYKKSPSLKSAAKSCCK